MSSGCRAGVGFCVLILVVLSVPVVYAGGVVTNFTDSGGGDLGDVYNVIFDSNGSNTTAYVRLPKNSTVTSGGLDVSGFENYSSYSYTNNNFPFIEPSGGDWDGTYFWILKINNQVYKYHANGTYANFSFSTPEIRYFTTGLDWDGTYFWIVEDNMLGTNEKVYRYFANGTYSNFSFSLFPEMPQGITSDNNYLWIVDYRGNIYKYYKNGTNVSHSFVVSGQLSSPSGITIYNNDFFIVGWGNKRVYRYYSNTTYTGENFYVGSEESTPATVISKNGRFWVGGGVTDRLYEYFGRIANLSLKVNGTQVWNMTGELNSTNSPQQITSLQTALNNEITECDTPDPSDSNYCLIQLNFTSATAGTVELSALTVTYNDDLMTIDFVNPTPGNDTRRINNQETINVTVNPSLNNPLDIDTCELRLVNGTNYTMTRYGDGTSVYCEGNFSTTDGDTYRYYVWANNTGGGTNTSGTRLFKENTRPATPDVKSPDNESIINTNYTLLNASSTDNDGDNLTYYFYGDNASGTTFLGSNSPGIYSWTNLNTDMTYNWFVHASDDYENSSNSSLHQFSVDYSAPTLNFVYPTDEDKAAISRNYTFVNITGSENLGSCSLKWNSTYYDMSNNSPIIVH